VLYRSTCQTKAASYFGSEPSQKNCFIFTGTSNFRADSRHPVGPIRLRKLAKSVPTLTKRVSLKQLRFQYGTKSASSLARRVGVPRWPPGRRSLTFVYVRESCSRELVAQALRSEAGEGYKRFASSTSTTGGTVAASALSFYQHAGDVVELGRIANEQIEFGHQALEQVGGLG
jgi:hypothetical protein